MFGKEWFNNYFDYKLKFPLGGIGFFLIFTSSKLREWKRSGF